MRQTQLIPPLLQKSPTLLRNIDPTRVQKESRRGAWVNKIVRFFLMTDSTHPIRRPCMGPMSAVIEEPI